MSFIPEVMTLFLGTPLFSRSTFSHRKPMFLVLEALILSSKRLYPQGSNSLLETSLPSQGTNSFLGADAGPAHPLSLKYLRVLP